MRYSDQKASPSDHFCGFRGFSGAPGRSPGGPRPARGGPRGSRDAEGGSPGIPGRRGGVLGILIILQSFGKRNLNSFLRPQFFVVRNRNQYCFWQKEFPVYLKIKIHTFKKIKRSSASSRRRNVLKIYAFLDFLLK